MSFFTRDCRIRGKGKFRVKKTLFQKMVPPCEDRGIFIKTSQERPAA